MYNRLLLEKISNGPHYVYSDTHDAVMRIEIEKGEVEVFVKYRNKREFKAAYDSKLVGLALSKEPIEITKEDYDNFYSSGKSSLLTLLNLAFIFSDPVFDMAILTSF